MAGTKAGGMKVAKAMKQRHGRNYYREIGRLGGSKGRTGGFYYMAANGQLDRLKAISAKGGQLGHRGPAKGVA